MIQVEPSGVCFEAQEGETIMAAAIRCGFTWPTICGGQGTCKTCVCLTLDGEEHLSAVGAWERQGLESIADTLPNGGDGWRLACQAELKDGAVGDIKLRKGGVRVA